MSRHVWRAFLALLAGTAVAAATPILHSLISLNGTKFSLASIDPDGTIHKLFNVGAGFTGGLAFDPSADLFYAISSDQDAASVLHSISWSGEVTPLFSLGYGFFGGLTSAGATGSLYAIGGDEDGIQRRLHLIDVASASATSIADLGDGSVSFDGGIAYLDRTYLLGHDGVDSRLFSYAPLEKQQELHGVYRSVFFPAAGGLARDPAGNAWWALTSDLETGQPLIVSFDSSGEVSRFRFEVGLTGLTFAEGVYRVPEPGSAVLLAAGWAAILLLKRRAQSAKQQGAKS